MALFLFLRPRMKKLDKLIITSFLGPFFLTFLVVVFILLNINMLKYFDDIIGKDLGWDVIGELFFYFAVFNTPVALPLAVLLSSLITFGNLGEHFELTAIKSLGVSLTRALIPISFLVVFITGLAFLINNYLVPKAALEAYSLLWDIKQKKPSLDLREGAFYAAIPDVNIKVNKKFPDGIALKGVVIYDHRGRSGNREVTVADSGRMFTVMNSRYLKLELFKGYNYSDGDNAERDMTGQSNSRDTFRKTHFEKTYVIFDLSSFNLQQTEKKWFKGNRIMRNISELESDMDSVSMEMNDVKLNIFDLVASSESGIHKNLNLHYPKELVSSILKEDSTKSTDVIQKGVQKKSWADSSVQRRGVLREKIKAAKGKKTKDVKIRPANIKNMDSLLRSNNTSQEIGNALGSVRNMKSQLSIYLESLKSQRYEYHVFNIQWHKILANSIACLVMFLIGAPLGSIIKRGGLGVPVLASIIFFILFYVMSLLGEKWAKQEAISVVNGVWAANVILFGFGLIFLRQARLDARLFESDFYMVVVEKIKRRFNDGKD